MERAIDGFKAVEIAYRLIKAKNMAMNEEELLKKLTPVIEERIRYKIVRDIVDALEAQLYPPEEMFREDFVKKVGEAEGRVKEGKVKSFKNAEELDVFLDTLKSEE